MKHTQKLILLTLSFLALPFVHADQNGLIFPPANALANAGNGGGYVFPPQMPARPMLNRAPQMPNYNNSGRSFAPRSFAPWSMTAPTIATPRRHTAPAQYPPQYSQYQNRQQAAYPARPSQIPNARQRAMAQQYPRYPTYSRRNSNNSFPFSNNFMPFGNSGNNSFPFSSGNMPFGNGNGFGMPSNPMNNMFRNNSGNMPFFTQRNTKKRKKAWGKKRNIWPDFYTDFTDDAWDSMTKGPRDLGKMPGGWRFPYISTPDPVTVSDAITNQFPPIAEEAGKMADFSDWGIFDNK